VILGIPWTDLVMWGVVLFVCAPASLRSPVALTLLVWWLAGMGVWLVLGTVPPGVSIALDLVAFGFVVWRACTAPDIIVAGLFFSSIHAHAVLDPFNEWAMTWAIGIAQMLLAGLGALRVNSWREHLERREAARDDLKRLWERMKEEAAIWVS
jgi:mannose/fructose/N-acetylgalactosamine-specific phosphotransferase system component IIC